MYVETQFLIQSGAVKARVFFYNFYLAGFCVNNRIMLFRNYLTVYNWLNSLSIGGVGLLPKSSYPANFKSAIKMF